MTIFRLVMTDKAIEHGTMSAQNLGMVRDPFAADLLQLQDVLDALDDLECRAIIKEIAEPMTAKEISDGCNIPLSTTYRKLELLADASLVEEQTELRASGRHTARYALDFDAVHVALAEDRSLEVTVDHPERTPDQQLSEIWAEVSKR
jgi:predicted transcriptional regulator